MSFFVIEDFDIVFPDYFPKPIYDFKNNPLTDKKIELGRQLFYDPILSGNGKISCASCHSPYYSFAQHDQSLSVGINEQIGSRNAPAIFNLAWQKDFMWDGTILHLDEQALAPITHPKEMGGNILLVVKNLNESSKYRNLFSQAFGNSLVTSENLFRALAQFQLTLISANSKYDQVKMGKMKFSEQEERGYEVFLEKCNSCHTEPLFSDYKLRNIGLKINPKLNDYGRWNVTKLDEDYLKFKTPSLRNLSFTAPYMHDGRFAELSEVIDHYNLEIERSPTLDKDLTYPLIFSSNQKKDLIAFLLCLNDSSFVNNRIHHFPEK